MARQDMVRRPADVIPFLHRCGYEARDIRLDYRFGTDDSVAVAAFAHAPHDARSICIAVGAAGLSAQKTAESLRYLSAPVLLLLTDTGMQWWKPGAEGAERLDVCGCHEVPEFFARHRTKLAPEKLFRAKNFGRHQTPYQLDFVDLGLLPFAEQAMGEKLSELIENVLREGLNAFPPPKSEAQGRELVHWLFESAFLLLAGKILRDKDVPGFADVDLHNVSDARKRVRAHYGQALPFPGTGTDRADVLGDMAQRIAGLSPLCNLTTETLGYIYERAMISKETRQRLGTHSTPAYLIDYIVWELVDWIADLPADRRHVYEPTCGHAGFLIAAMRLLRDLHEDGEEDAATRHDYLRERLHGLELDDFARQIARLGLTLADVPNPNGWDLRCADIFTSAWPAADDPRPDVLFMNPPFEAFDEAENTRYAQPGLTYQHKAVEVFARTVQLLRPGGVFGVVMPQGMLRSRDARPLREALSSEFELRAVTLFPDKVFAFSDAESAVLLGRRHNPNRAVVRIGRVDDWDIDRFRRDQTPSDVQTCAQSRLAEQPGCELRIPRQDDVWRELDHLPRLRTLVEGGKGFEHIGKANLPEGATTVDDQRFPGAVRGFTTFGAGRMLHQLPTERWVSLTPDVIRRPLWGTATGQAQVLLNYAPVSREPWRLKALLDPEGHAVTSRFVVLRPVAEGVALEFVWALLNSPLGNAYAFCHLGKRENTVGVLLDMPVPRFAPEDADRVTRAVRRYLDAVRTAPDGLRADVCALALRNLMLHVDAEVLRLYDLPPRMERRVLDLFQGHERVGVPFQFTEYFAEDFRPCIPLHEYLSDAYRRTTAGELRKRLRTVDDPEITTALRIATDAFTLEEDV